jgi:hypothetical protein
MSTKNISYSVITCDRCGKEQKIAGCNYYGASYASMKTRLTFPQCGGEVKNDLCGDCWSEFLDWIDNKEKE